MDTIGSSNSPLVTPRIPFKAPLAASMKTEFNSSLVVDFLTVTTKSTTETVGVGTRKEKPSNLPDSSGITSPRALVAPDVVGIIFKPAARERLSSFLCPWSSIIWSFVYEWIVVMTPEMIPKFECSTLATGARQFVVQEALDSTWWFSGSYFSSFTPRTIVISSFLAGAEIITFLAPPFMIWSLAPALPLPGSPIASVNMPVDSITIATPNSFQGMFPGSFSWNTLISFPSTTRPFPEIAIFILLDP